MPKIRRAIVSVTDKTGVVDFCKVLSGLKIEILSTGGTAKALREAGIPVTDVSEWTGFPECLDGRLKTLHPKIEGGILGIRGNPQHEQDMKRLGIEPIDMVVVNLYAFEKTASDPDCTLDHAVENIDIGGPTMIRAAAKNYQDVTVIVDEKDYQEVSNELQKNGGSISKETNFKLAAKVFERTAAYDGAIGNYLSQMSLGGNIGVPSPLAPKRRGPFGVGDDVVSLSNQGQGEGERTVFPKNLNLEFEKIEDLRYGENPHQKGASYRAISPDPGSLVTAKKLHGKELSYNNLIDLEAALDLVCVFEGPACVIVKHTNPCGMALGKTIAEAFLRAKECDPVSSFGGIIGFNRTVDALTAKAIGETFFECIVAPDYDKEAMALLTARKNLRLLSLEPFQKPKGEWQIRRIGGGLLVQEKDEGEVDLKKCAVPTKRKPTDEELRELDFAWKVAKHVKSNAIVFTRDRQIIGVGAGQMSRVDSVKIAVMKARKSLKGSVLASDAFFPFRDGLDFAAKQGITAVVQPGGSLRDAEVIASADEHGLAMVMTGMRHFRH